nr:ribonuclease H-like domain-containing protein [Tanacetum cinerariifolium]
TGLLEFKDDTVTDYSMPTPAIESTLDDAQNRNPSVTETETSPSTILPKSFIKFVKANDSPTKSKTDKAEKAKKPPVKSKLCNEENACFNCGDFNHLAYNCRKRVKKGTSRSQNNTHKSFTPRPVVHKPHRPPMRPMRSNMNAARSNITSFNKPAHSYTKRPFQRTSAVRSQFRALWVPTVNRNFPTVNRKFPTANRKFPTGSTKFSTTDMGKKENVVKASAPSPSIESTSDDARNRNPSEASPSTILPKSFIMFVKANDSPTKSKTNKVETAKKPPVKYAEQYRKPTKKPNIRGNQRNWNNLKSHQLGNISYLSDYEPFDGGCVSFGQGGCKITGKETIKTGKLKFENVYFMKDLKYNLFSVSQIYDNKNSVLFTDSECIVLGRDFKLLDDANVLLRTHRQHNMYSIDLNNIVPHKDRTCLVAKASADE